MGYSLIYELRQCGEMIRPIDGDSMMPMLDAYRDAVRLAAVNNPKSYPICRGDIILYLNSADKLILHRVIRVERRFVFTCGDNRTVIEKVPKHCIIAICNGFFKGKKFVSLESEEYIKYTKNVLEHKICYIDNSMRYLMHLYISALRGEQPGNPEYEPNYNIIFKLCEHHRITSAVSRSVNKISSRVPSDIHDAFVKNAFLNTCQIQMYEDAESEVFNALEENEISYMPIEGWLISTSYPEKSMCEFSGCDVLCHIEDREKIRRIFTNLGYSCQPGKFHDSYKYGRINIEVHVKLFGNESRFFNYYSDVWNRSVKLPGSEFRYGMKNEDFYVYLAAHMSKHMPNDICSLHFYGDFYEIRKYLLRTGFDYSYVNRELAKLNLEQFEKNMIDFTEKMFNADYLSCQNIFSSVQENSSSESYQTLTLDEQRKLKSIIYSAAYDSIENYVEEQINKFGRTEYLRRCLFPSREQLKISYPKLEKYRSRYFLYVFHRFFHCFSVTEKRKAAIQKFHIIRKRQA